jgi:small subunit ribosomal protein S9
MKYIYYTNNNGDISMISPVPDSTTSDPYITVSDAEGDQFMTGELLQHDYFIDLDLKTIKKKYRPTFNQHLLLRRDSRIKERRKYGLKKARKASQYSKR